MAAKKMVPAKKTAAKKVAAKKATPPKRTAAMPKGSGPTAPFSGSMVRSGEGGGGY